MKYFIDTEFIEGFHKPLFGKRRHFIDLISIGIVAEDGREYYAVSSEYNYKDASDWVKNNVIVPAYCHMVSGNQRMFSEPHNFHKYYGKPNAQIANEIIGFVEAGNSVPRFYGDYSDYDWVLLCSLFGTMMDLPVRFPMFCVDVNQMKEDLMDKIAAKGRNSVCARTVKQTLFSYEESNTHVAIEDARETKRKYEFLKRLHEKIDSPGCGVPVAPTQYQHLKGNQNKNR